MPFLNVGAITDVQIQIGAAGANEPELVGEVHRSFNGTMRSTIRAQKRSWEFTTYPMTTAEATTLRANAVGIPVSCSGDALGGTVTCLVQVLSVNYISETPTVIRHEMQLRLEEV